MIGWFSADKKRAVQEEAERDALFREEMAVKARQKAERDALLRAELAIKARQFDDENGHLFGVEKENHGVEAEPAGGNRKPSSERITIGDIAARTF